MGILIFLMRVDNYRRGCHNDYDEESGDVMMTMIRKTTLLKTFCVGFSGLMLIDLSAWLRDTVCM